MHRLVYKDESNCHWNEIVLEGFDRIFEGRIRNDEEIVDRGEDHDDNDGKSPRRYSWEIPDQSNGISMKNDGW